MISAQVCIRLLAIKGHRCWPDDDWRERAIGMLTAGMSTIAVAHVLNVQFSTIDRLQMCVRKFGGTSSQNHIHQPSVTTFAKDLHIQRVHIQDRQRPVQLGQLPKQSVCKTKEFPHKLSETILGKLIYLLVILISVEWANSHNWLRRWWGVLFTNESRFRRQMANRVFAVVCCVGVVFWCQYCVARGGGGVMVQQAKARPHVARIWTQFLGAKKGPSFC